MKSDYSLRQNGVALIVALVMLLAMTLIGVTAMKGTMLEEKMAGNARDRNLAFQAAEAGLRDGEKDIHDNLSLISPFHSDCTNGMCLPSSSETAVWEDSTKVHWENSTNVIAYGANTGAALLFGVAAQPVYVVERLPAVVSSGNSLVQGFAPPNPEAWFRVTARGTGGTTTARVMLQSVYRK